MRLLNLFIQDVKNFVFCVNCLFQILMLFYNCICDLLFLQYYICVNCLCAFIVIKSCIISNWHYLIICSLIIILRMYCDKCDDIYEMYNYEKQKNNDYETTHTIVMFDMYKLKHNVNQVNVNFEIKIKLLMYKHDSSLYKLYDGMLDKNYILNHKYNQLLINKHIEKYPNNLFKRKNTIIES